MVLGWAGLGWAGGIVLYYWCTVDLLLQPRLLNSAYICCARVCLRLVSQHDGGPVNAGSWVHPPTQVYYSAPPPSLYGSVVIRPVRSTEYGMHGHDHEYARQDNARQDKTSTLGWFKLEPLTCKILTCCFIMYFCAVFLFFFLPSCVVFWIVSCLFISYRAANEEMFPPAESATVVTTAATATYSAAEPSAAEPAPAAAPGAAAPAAAAEATSNGNASPSPSPAALASLLSAHHRPHGSFPSRCVLCVWLW